MRESTRLLRFAIIGTANALITALIVYLMMEVFQVGYLVSNVVGYLIAQIHNFFWSSFWIFPATFREHSLGKRVLLFSLAVALAYSAQFIILLLLVEGLHMNEYWAQFLGLFVYGGVNFLINRNFTFK